MGLFSSVGKAFKKAVPLVTTAVGAYYGGTQGASFGSQAGKMLGGDSEWIDGLMKMGGLGSSALDMYNNYQQQKSQGEAYDQAYERQLAGIQMQNASAKELATQAQDWSALQAQKQMDFQKGMSMYAHQHEVNDLRAAGLNPILSGTGGMGASTPSGASGTAQVAPVRSEGDAVTSAFQAFTAMADAMKANAATTFMSGAQTAKTQAETQATTSTIDVNATRARLNRDQSLKIASEIQNIMEIRKNIPKTGQLTDAQTATQNQTLKNLQQTFRQLKIDGNISEQDYKFWQETIGGASKSAQSMGTLLHMLKSLVK